jgi:outer membrane receptor for ferrienterochelin and colicins
MGNDSLRPETSVYAGLSGDYVVNKQLSVNANLFQNSVKDKIDLFYNSTDASKAQYNNLPGKTIIRGAKLVLNYNWNNKLRVQLGSQLNGQSKIQSDAYNWSTDASMNANYNFQKLKSKISVFYKYNGKFIFYTADYDEVGSLDKVNENFLDKYHSLDFVVTKWLWDEKVEISTGVKNAFNNTNILGRGSSGVHSGGGANDNPVGWGRSFFIQLQFNLNYDRKVNTQ